MARLLLQLKGSHIARRSLRTRHAFVPVDDEVAFAVENDIVVDGDFCLGHYRRRTVARDEMQTSAFSNGIADAALGAMKRADWSTDSVKALALAARGCPRK